MFGMGGGVAPCSLTDLGWPLELEIPHHCVAIWVQGGMWPVSSPPMQVIQLFEFFSPGKSWGGLIMASDHQASKHQPTGSKVGGGGRMVCGGVCHILEGILLE